jgi:hypothetical protein
MPAFQVSNRPVMARDMSIRQGLPDHIVYPIAEDLAIRTAETSPQEEAAIGVPVPSVRAFDRLNPNSCRHFTFCSICDASAS